MSIFDSRTSEVRVYDNADGRIALLIDSEPGDEWPFRTLSEDMDWMDMRERGFRRPAGSITGTATYIRATNDSDGWAHHVFQVAMRYQGRRMQARFRVGTGWAEAPTVRDVLESMILDYRLTEHESADSLGYEPERAASIERQINSQTARLRKFLPGL